MSRTGRRPVTPWADDQRGHLRSGADQALDLDPNRDPDEDAELVSTCTFTARPHSCWRKVAGASGEPDPALGRFVPH
jgi:hypothetical protein